MPVNVHSTVSANSLRYFDYMWANYSALASAPGAVRFHVYCLDRFSAWRLRGDPRVASVTALPYGRGSSGHALAIESALGKSVAGEVNVIADTDTAIFLPGWDKAIQAALADGAGCGIIGTRLEDIGGFSSGATAYQQYKGKPTTTWMALSPRYDFSSLQVRPDKANFIPVTTPELASIYNLPIGYFVVKDTGWQIPSFLHDRAIPYIAFELVKPTAPNAKALAGTSTYHDEFHWNGVPFLAHQRGSMKHRFRVDPLSRDFYDACDRYLGAPDWAVEASWLDYARAGAQDAWRAVKELIKTMIGRGR